MRPWIVALAIIGIIYGALVALVQPNMKKLVAYSSVSHLGFVVLGLFSFNQQGLDGAVYVMLAHGISTGALFMLVGYLYERRHSLEIADYGGVATPAPWLATIFLVTTLASIGLPTLKQLRRRVSGAAGRGDGELPVGGLRGGRRDSLGLLHALDVPAHVLRTGSGNAGEQAVTDTVMVTTIMLMHTITPYMTHAHDRMRQTTRRSCTCRT